MTRIRESLLALPILVVIGCVVLAFAALWADSRFDETLSDWRIVLSSTVAGGRAIATTVAGATITVAAIVFSITALSTQMAANQYSPRALGGFFEDKIQQVTIGLVVGTFTYSLIVLGSLSGAIVDGVDPTPSVSVTLAVLLGVLSAIAIVGFLNHSLHRMQIDSVVRRIAAASNESIARHLENPEAAGDLVDSPPPQGESVGVKAERGGWIVQMDPQKALEAIPPESTARVDVRLGEAVSAADRLATIWPEPPEDWDGANRLRRAIVTAPERSLEMDPTFGIRQLVDIALRALSPGVNDPTTAVDVIHHLKTPVRKVLLSDAPQRVFTGEGNRRLFLTETPSRTDYVHSAFSEIRLAAKGQPYVLRALIEVLSDLEADLSGEDLQSRQSAVSQELDLTVDVARQSNFPEYDLRRVLKEHFDEDQDG